MKPIGYVSDERFLALPDVAVEVRSDDQVWRERSSASGAIYLDLPPGHYQVTLAKQGYGAKHSDVELGPGVVHQFRLLSDTMYGYIWPKWARAGELGEFRVHSPEPYRLSMWRYGATAEQVRLIGWFDEHAPRATVQITPDGDYTQVGARFNQSGYADPTHRQYVSASARSGLYYFHAETETGAHFAFPWVVAPAEPTSRIAVLASTNTWNAYNNFGGRSNYINAAGLPDVPLLVPRLELARYQDATFGEHGFPDGSYPPLSFERPEPLNQLGRNERPTDPIRRRQPCHLAAAEWRLLSWLEQNEYAYDLYADAHLHDGTLPLDRYRVLVISTHPEYWSRQMYQAVSDWVFKRGGRLAYLGGNGLDCEVEFVAPDSLVFRTEAVPADGPYENRMHRSFAPTSALLGVVFTDAGAMTSAPYTVLDASHWAFAGTGVADGDEFGAASLHERCPGGASGHETDKTTPYTPDGAEILARGRNVDNGGAEIVHFTTASGGAVFSVGSITWPASVLVDDVISRITKNVIERLSS